jgi:hypothetical protein
MTNLLHSPLSEGEWENSTLGSLYKSRVQLCEKLQNLDEKAIFQLLSSIPRNDIRSLATVLNDCPEPVRKKALSSLYPRDPQIYTECIHAISEYQKSKVELDPFKLFPCVATKALFANDEANCSKCGNEFEEGDNITWEDREHAAHSKCNYPNRFIPHLPVEMLEHITGNLSLKDIISTRRVNHTLSSIGTDRLDPVIYLSSTFLYPVSLIAEMADNGCCLSGSRALEFFVPGSIEENSDWDFFVNGYASCVTRMMKALQDSGVKWDLLEDRIQAFLRGDTQHLTLKVAEILNILCWPTPRDDSVVQFLSDIRDSEPPIYSLDRMAQITVSRIDGNFKVSFPDPDHAIASQDAAGPEAESDAGSDAGSEARSHPGSETGSDELSHDGDASTASGGHTFSVLTGYVKSKGRSSKVQLIICHSFGRPQSCLQAIMRFHSTPVQCFMGGFGVGHLFYDTTASKAGTIWNPKYNCPNRESLRIKSLEKYERRGYKLLEQDYPDYPPKYLTFKDKGAFYIPYSQLYQHFESFMGLEQGCSHPVKQLLISLEWGLRGTSWCLGKHGLKYSAHPLLMRARDSVVVRGMKKYPDSVRRRQHLNPHDYKSEDVDDHWNENEGYFRLARYVEQYAPIGIPGVRPFDEGAAGSESLRRMRRSLRLSGSVGCLRENSSVSFIL